MTDVLDHATLADPDADTRTDRLNSGLSQLSAATARLSPLREHWNGEAPAAFLSKDARDALDKRLRRLAVNFPRLTVLALAERIRIAGIVDKRNGRPLDDGQGVSLWDSLVDAGIRSTSGVVTVDRLLYGTSYATVWATEESRLTLTTDSPWTMTHAADPATGATEYAVRAWSAGDGAAAVLYEPETITRYKLAASTEPTAGPGWQVVRRFDNPLGVVPVVPFVRQVSATDPTSGDSIVRDILDLSDAVSKLLADAMVTSEWHARPRRWATGLEIEEDEDGNAIDPFGNGRFLQSESPETKFGQLEPARLDGYGDMIGTLTQQIGSLTGLPPTYLGLHGDQPPSSDAVKAQEVQLTMRAYAEQEGMERGWQDVAWLASAVLAGAPAVPSDRRRYAVAWGSPEIRTQAQASDAAAKLAGIGVPLESLLADPLGYSPDQITDILAAARRAAPTSAAASNV